MGLQLHARRAMQRVAHAARNVATHAMQGIDAARPIYEVGRPVLHHLGVNTAIADGSEALRRDQEGAREVSSRASLGKV